MPANRAVLVVFALTVCALIQAEACSNNREPEQDKQNNKRFTGDNLVINGNNNVIVGNSPKVDGNNNQIEGNNANVRGNNNRISGNAATVNGNNNKVQGTSKANVFGNNANLEIDSASVIGNNANIKGSNALGVGNNIGVEGNGARLYGNNLRIVGNDGYACSNIGKGVEVEVNGEGVRVEVRQQGRENQLNNIVDVNGINARVRSRCDSEYSYSDLPVNNYEVRVTGRNVVLRVNGSPVDGSTTVGGNKFTVSNRN